MSELVVKNGSLVPCLEEQASIEVVRSVLNCIEHLQAHTDNLTDLCQCIVPMYAQTKECQLYGRRMF